MSDQIRYESKKAFSKAAAAGKAIAPGLQAFAEAVARWSAQREFSKLVAKRKNAGEDKDQQEDLKP